MPFREPCSSSSLRRELEQSGGNGGALSVKQPAAPNDFTETINKRLRALARSIDTAHIAPILKGGLCTLLLKVPPEELLDALVSLPLSIPLPHVTNTRQAPEQLQAHCLYRCATPHRLAPESLYAPCSCCCSSAKALGALKWVTLGGFYPCVLPRPAASRICSEPSPARGRTGTCRSISALRRTDTYTHSTILIPSPKN